jgi:long-chain acyl-CoA synthetase
VTTAAAPAAEPEVSVNTIADLPFHFMGRFPRPVFIGQCRGTEIQGLSSKESFERIRDLSLGLSSLGMTSGDRIAIVAESRPEWIVSDLAILAAGGVTVPIYPTLSAAQARYILQDSGARIAIVSTRQQLEKIQEVRHHLPSLEAVVLMDAAAAQDGASSLSLDAVMARGHARMTGEWGAGREFRDAARAVRPDALATIIYTSGTTGAPKGVMLTHDNIYSNVKEICLALGSLFREGTDQTLSFLPLSHILERMAGHYLMFATGTSIAYAESMDTVPINMQEVRPTIVISVPRLYEKMYARVLENAMAGSAVKKRIFFWARKVAERWADVKLSGGTPRGLLAMQYAIAQKLVFSKLKARTGGRLRFFVSGGAPLAPDINKFFYAAGLTILEGYGLTETSPVIGVNTPEQFRLGTIGRPIPSVEVKIAPDGEILTRGPHVMKGYYKNPEATRETIDAERWLHTGDIGLIEDGYIRITDRKKDIIVTAGGKNIAPQPIENKVKTNKYVSQAVMIGDKRKYPIMVVVPNFDQLEKWAAQQNLVWTDRAQLLAMPTVRAKMEKEVQSECGGLAKYEMPKKVALLEHDFSIERGELTPTLKVKRRVIDKHYQSLVDALYAEPVAEHETVAT